MTSSEIQATKDALNEIRKHGSDLDRPLTLDFFVAVPDQSAGARVASWASEQGFETSVEADDDAPTWTCYCTRTMIPALDAVLGTEAMLDKFARTVGGYIDGFGTLGNAGS